MSNQVEHAVEALKATPAATTSALIIMGYSLSDWVLFGSAALIVLQITFLLRDKLYRPWKDKRDRRND